MPQGPEQLLNFIQNEDRPAYLPLPNYDKIKCRMEKKDLEIERFPVEKKQIRYEEPPELIFFDVDEDAEEADFIRVDDLFASEAEPLQKLTGSLSFTLFPAVPGVIIDSRMARSIHKNLILTSIRLDKPLEKVRIRPVFAQWQIEVLDDEEPESLIREFRADLEEFVHAAKKLSENERFWSDNCFVSPVDKEISDETIMRLAGIYQNAGSITEVRQK